MAWATRVLVSVSHVSARSRKYTCSATIDAASTITMPSAASAITPQTSRPRSDVTRRTSTLPQAVAEATNRVDQRRAGRVQLLPQPGHHLLHHAVAEVVPPHVLEHLALRHHPTGVDHQVAQQPVLGGGQ